MLLPTFLLTPFFGISADRINPRNGLLVTGGLQGAVAALAGVIAAQDALTLGPLLFLAFAFGAVSAAHTPIRLALIPRLVERAALPSAIGYSAIIFNTSRIIAPALAAWLLTLTSVANAFYASGALCGCAVLMLSRVAGTGRDGPVPERGSIAVQLRDGFRYFLAQPAIRGIFLLTMVSGFLGRTAIELLPAVSGKLLSGDSTTLATLTASAGVGSILGGLLVSRQGGGLPRLLQLVLLGVSCAALVLLTAAAWRSLPIAAGAIALIALCTTTIGTGCQALTQLIVEEDYRGRVMSLWAVVAMGAPAIGAVLIGSLADVIGFPPAFALSAGAALLVVLFLRGRLQVA